jgi:hypothetical protein
MTRTLPKADLPLLETVPFVGAFDDPPPSAEELSAFLADETAAAEMSMKWRMGESADLASGTIERAQPAASAQTGAHKDAQREIERAMVACANMPNGQASVEVSSLLNKAVVIGEKLHELREEQESKVRISGWYDELTEIYRRYGAGDIEFEAYDDRLKRFLAVSVGTAPTEELLEILDFQPDEIANPSDEPCAKRAGPRATAEHALGRVLDVLGCDTPHSGRTLDKYRSKSPGRAAQRKTVEVCGESGGVPRGHQLVGRGVVSFELSRRSGSVKDWRC